MIEKVFADFGTELENAKNEALGRGAKLPNFADVGAIITELLKYVFPLSGLVLLFFLINGGFDLMTSAGDPKKTEVGKEKITAAIVGFIIIFTAFWIYQIIKYILGIT